MVARLLGGGCQLGWWLIVVVFDGIFKARSNVERSESFPFVISFSFTQVIDDDSGVWWLLSILVVW